MGFKRSGIKLRVETIARCSCATMYMVDHPGCSEDTAWGHSNRHWRAFVEGAIDIMALTEAIGENEAAPWN